MPWGWMPKICYNAKQGEHRLTSVLSLSVYDLLISPPPAAVDRLRRQVQQCADLRVGSAPHVALDKACRLVVRQLKGQDVRDGPLWSHCADPCPELSVLLVHPPVGACRALARGLSPPALLSSHGAQIGHRYFVLSLIHAARYSPQARCVAGPKDWSTSSAYPQARRNSCSLPTVSPLSPNLTTPGVVCSAGYAG